MLLALVSLPHVHHAAAVHWFSASDMPFATCPITQGALLRVLIHIGEPTWVSCCKRIDDHFVDPGGRITVRLPSSPTIHLSTPPASRYRSIYMCISAQLLAGDMISTQGSGALPNGVVHPSVFNRLLEIQATSATRTPSLVRMLRSTSTRPPRRGRSSAATTT